MSRRTARRHLLAAPPFDSASLFGSAPLFVILFLSLCTPEARAQRRVAPSSLKTIIVTEENDGGEINLPHSGTLVVRLASNPSTGYTWRMAQNESSLLKPVGDEYVPSRGKLLGAPGVQVFRFKAVAAGGTELILLYQSSTLKGVAAAKQFWVLVTIDRPGESSRKKQAGNTTITSQSPVR